jgi:hypothetical protein
MLTGLPTDALEQLADDCVRHYAGDASYWNGVYDAVRELFGDEVADAFFERRNEIAADRADRERIRRIDAAFDLLDHTA